MLKGHCLITKQNVNKQNYNMIDSSDKINIESWWLLLT